LFQNIGAKWLGLASEQLVPICLPLEPDERFFRENLVGTVLGWGLTQEG